MYGGVCTRRVVWVALYGWLCMGSFVWGSLYRVKLRCMCFEYGDSRRIDHWQRTAMPGSPATSAVPVNYADGSTSPSSQAAEGRSLRLEDVRLFRHRWRLVFRRPSEEVFHHSYS
jgi:hypothetical protein